MRHQRGLDRPWEDLLVEEERRGGAVEGVEVWCHVGVDWLG